MAVAVCDTVQWTVREGCCRTDGAVGKRVYGIEGRLGNQRWLFEDIAVDRRRVELLCKQLERTQPSPVHFADIIEDFLAE